MKFNVPNSLRKKYVSSEISREIFFIDCFNDLYHCANSNHSYDFVRSSVLLRMLLLDKGLESISKKHDFELKFFANQFEIIGNQLSGRQTRHIKEIFTEMIEPNRNTSFLTLLSEPLKEYNRQQFIEKICLKIQGTKEHCFSVKNIIEIISNKHGGAHLEDTFDASTYESFFLGQFSPYSLKDGNFFLLRIKEILIILVISILPLYEKIIEDLQKYNDENTQREDVSSAFMMTYEQYKEIE